MGYKEKLLAMKPRLHLKRAPLQAGLEPGTARSRSAFNLLSYRVLIKEQSDLSLHCLLGPICPNI